MAKKASNFVTVKVIGQPVHEDGESYPKGATFETTSERAEALAGLVEPTGAKEPAPEA